ncbi:MAG: OmpH family outer membrane protein [Thermodesulfobacteriota bacterium]|nr:OmpH family outer membrane protein [Thermodesulfobacteriota bacterium]
MKKIAFIFALFLILSLPVYATASGIEGIAYVDLQKALNMCVAGQNARANFSEKVNKTREVIEKRQEELKQFKESIEKQSILLSEDAKKEKQRDYEKEVREYQRLLKDSQEELKREEAEMTKRIIGELRKVVQILGKEGNYTVILEKSTSGILYAADAIDLTDKIIKTHNEESVKNEK